MSPVQTYRWFNELGDGTKGWRALDGTTISHGTPPASAPKWPGDPGDGNFNIGWALGPNGNLTIPAARNNYGWPGDSKVSVIHDYSNNSNGVSSRMLDDPINAGFIPSQSFKMPAWSPAEIASGAADAAIEANIINPCLARAPHPIWLCYFHEPEDDWTTAQQKTDYRAAYRRIVNRANAAGVTNVAWMPIYMNPYTFAPESSGRDWKTWHADWNGSGWHDTVLMTVLGGDTYNPLPRPITDPYGPSKGFGQMWTRLLELVEVPGAPKWDYVQPEFGMSYRATPSPDWVAWATEARDFAKANRIKNFNYWDNSADTGRYSFGPTHDPSGNKKAGWDLIVAASKRWGA